MANNEYILFSCEQRDAWNMLGSRFNVVRTAEGAAINAELYSSNSFPDEPVATDTFKLSVGEEFVEEYNQILDEFPEVLSYMTIERAPVMDGTKSTFIFAKDEAHSNKINALNLWYFVNEDAKAMSSTSQSEIEPKNAHLLIRCLDKITALLEKYGVDKKFLE